MPVCAGNDPVVRGRRQFNTGSVGPDRGCTTGEMRSEGLVSFGYAEPFNISGVSDSGRMLLNDYESVDAE